MAETGGRCMAGKSDAGTQTAPIFTRRADIADFKAQGHWSRATVDPFLNDIRKHILAHKPEDLVGFTLECVAAHAAGKPLPETVIVETRGKKGVAHAEPDDMAGEPKQRLINAANAAPASR
jgi:hypothetical protein